MTEEQLREIGAELGNGGRPPKVALRESSAGLPAGTVGAVVRIGDPTESEEFVVVRIHKDELPFTPAELEPAPPRAKRSKPAPAAPAPKPAQTAAASAAQRTPAATVSVPAVDGAAGSAPAADTAPATDRAPAARSATQPTRPAVGAESQTRPSPRSEGGRRSTKRQVPKLTVQLHYDERGWTVEASRGARSVVKATPVRPAAALQIAELLDNEQVSQAIAEIAQAERDEAERRAADLRAQLAEVEAVLAGYDET